MKLKRNLFLYTAPFLMGASACNDAIAYDPEPKIQLDTMYVVRHIEIRVSGESFRCMYMPVLLTNKNGDTLIKTIELEEFVNAGDTLVIQKTGTSDFQILKNITLEREINKYRQR